MRFIPNHESVQQAMLAEIGVPSIEALFDSIPEAVRLKRALDIPPGMSEQEQLELFAGLAAKNRGADCTSFLGGGSYAHYIPLISDTLVQRAEFFTSYTPYQPEVSQGTLQAIFEFQTFMTALTGMDVANASLYDGASATAEAILMADRLQSSKKQARDRVLLPATLHPYYRSVVETYTRFLPITLETVPADADSGRLDLAALNEMLGSDVVCVLAQQPNLLGVIEDLPAISAAATEAGALVVTTVTEALSLALLQPPGAAGADIVVGEGQSLGVPVYYGGPYLGFMAAREAHKRQMPGRIAGMTEDTEGRRGFVLTLATREQHIRRERATSNICTNQNLVMLMSLMYLTVMGRKGLREVAHHNVSLMAYFLSRLEGLPGYRRRHSGPVFNEVTVACPRPAGEVVRHCLARDLVPGIDLGRFNPDWGDDLLVAVTEMNTKHQIDALIKALAEVAA